MDALEREARRVLLALALTASGRVAQPEGSPGRRRPEDHIPTLGRGDAPHLRHAARYQRATTPEERMAAIQAARDELASIHHSPVAAPRSESIAELCERIVARGEGFPAVEVAAWARTSASIVRRCRREAGRDEEHGRPPANGRAMPVDERRARVADMAARGLNGREISRALGISYSTVRRDMGLK